MAHCNLSQACLDCVSAVLRPGVRNFEGRLLLQSHVARALTILVDLWLPLKWAHKIKQALHLRADDRLEVAAAKIQKIARVVAAHNCTAVKRLARGRAVRAQLKQTASVSIQKRLARGPSTRAATALLAMRAFRKYVVDRHEVLQYAAPAIGEDDDMLTEQSIICYWAFVGTSGGDLVNVKAKRRFVLALKGSGTRVSWVKPKLLRDKDVARISQRPTRRTAYVVDCAYCGVQAAEKVCLDSCADPHVSGAPKRKYGKCRPGFVSNVIRVDKARLHVGIAVSVGLLFTAEESGSGTGFTS